MGGGAETPLRSKGEETRDAAEACAMHATKATHAVCAESDTCDKLQHAAEEKEKRKRRTESAQRMQSQPGSARGSSAGVSRRSIAPMGGGSEGRGGILYAMRCYDMSCYDTP